jgi:hypothetical protein
MLINCGNLLSQSNKLIKRLSDLDIVGDVEIVKVKETAVKGPKYELIRKYVLSEIEYRVILNNKVLPLKYIEQGIITNYKYNNINQLIEVENKYIEKYNVSAGKKVYHYNDRGKVVYELDYDKNGNLSDSIAVFYKNNTIIRTFYTANKDFFKKEEITYNEQHNELVNIQEIGGSKTRIINEYDSSGTKKISEKWYLDNRLIQNIKYTYNERGFLTTKSEYDDNGEAGSTTIYEYDVITGLVTLIKYGEHTTTYDYNFDANDNWLVKYEYYDDYPVKVVEREIRYRKK